MLSIRYLSLFWLKKASIL